MDEIVITAKRHAEVTSVPFDGREVTAAMMDAARAARDAAREVQRQQQAAQSAAEWSAGLAASRAASESVMSSVGGFYAQTARDWMPVVSDISGAVDFANHPTWLGGAAVAVGMVPIAGDGLAQVLRHTDDVPLNHVEEAVDATRRAIASGEVTTFADFRARSVVGDGLEGHELWQHANLNAHGLATTRLSTEASKLNPVIALESGVHQQVNAAQRSLNAASQTPIQNIRANAEILRNLGVVPESQVAILEEQALSHAERYGF